jgi:hypothetical protein
MVCGNAIAPLAQHADKHQQTVTGQEGSRQQAVLKEQDHKQDEIEHANHGRVGQRFKILRPEGMQ